MRLASLPLLAFLLAARTDAQRPDFSGDWARPADPAGDRTVSTTGDAAFQRGA